MIGVFPEFTELNLTDGDEYKGLTGGYTPISDISFATLMIWWSLEYKVKVAKLNDNIVIYYDSPCDRNNIGYSLVGTNKIDESIDTIFKELKANKSPAKLVHVPEFTVKSMADTGKYDVAEDADYNEYIIPVSNLFPLTNLEGKRRRALGRFIREVGNKPIELVELDCSDPSNVKKLLNYTNSWWKKYGSPNDTSNSEQKAMQVSIKHAVDLGMRNLCLFIDGDLSGLVIYQVAGDREYAIGNHMKARKDLYAIYEYLEYCFAEKAAEMGIPYLNFEMDLGIEGLRKHKTRLHPAFYHKKYCITPIH